MNRSPSSNSSGLLSNFISSLIAWAYVYVPIISGIVIGACFYFAKKPLTRLFRLKHGSRVWHAYPGSFHFLQIVVSLLFIWAILMISKEYRLPHLAQESFAKIGIALTVAIFGGLLCSVMHWIRGYGRDPEVQREVAGWRAEEYVAKLLETARRRHPDWQLWHGVLLVFAEGTAEEFSVEIDHLLLTASQVFLIETKSRSGTIIALPDARQWCVQMPHGDGTMRNALAQAKQTARVLRQQWQLTVPVIPVVAIHGQGTRIEQGPGNVVASDAVLQVIDAFEAQQPSAQPPPSNFAERIQQHRRSSAQAMHAHIVRAQAARAKAQRDQMRDCSSLQ